MKPLPFAARAGSAPLSRRTLLRGILGGAAVSVALPPLEAMACGTLPKRFGLFFWGNGNLPDRWKPMGEGYEWELSEQLAPLAAVKDLVTVVGGMSVKVPNQIPHGSGAAGLLSGAPLIQVGGNDTFQAPTIDQLIAEAIGGDTVYRSLQTAATNANGQSYNGTNSRNPPETSPFALYERLFGPTFREPGDEGIVDPKLGLRRSVLDAVLGDANALYARVGAADKARLDQHLTGLRELEQRLARLEEDPPNLEACARPPEPLADYPDVDGRPQISARSRAMCDLLAMSLACDQTRVVGHYLCDPVHNYLFPGASSGHHELTHNEGGDQPEVHAITLQCVEEMAYFIGTLAAIPEGDGTLLDSMALLCCSEVSLGKTHSLDDMPIVIAGNACGFLKQGFHYRSPAFENASSVMLTLLRAMDIPAADFGMDEAWTDQSLTDIEE